MTSGVKTELKVFLDTWVLVERYKGNQDAVKILRGAGTQLEAYISHITLAELVNVISRVYGEREALVQYTYLTQLPMTRTGTTEEISKNAGLLKTQYGFSLADSIILATAIHTNADVLVTGGEKQYQEEWKQVTEVPVQTLNQFLANL